LTILKSESSDDLKICEIDKNIFMVSETPYDSKFHEREAACGVYFYDKEGNFVKFKERKSKFSKVNSLSNGYRSEYDKKYDHINSSIVKKYKERDGKIVRNRSRPDPFFNVYDRRGMVS
jgi:hypothetical protein